MVRSTRQYIVIAYIMIFLVFYGSVLLFSEDKPTSGEIRCGSRSMAGITMAGGNEISFSKLTIIPSGIVPFPPLA